MIWQVAFYALLTDLATGLGAVPFLFFKNISRRWLGIGNAVAAGFMTAASLLLIAKGFESSLASMLIGVAVGVAAVWVTHAIISRQEFDFATAISQANLKKMLLVVGVMTLHSFAEGIGMGVAFGEGTSFGMLIILSMALQNIPEGLAISLVLVPRGASVRSAAAWSIFSSLPQPVMAVIAFYFIQHFLWLLPAGLGFAAGAMLWMVTAELLPEASAETSWLTAGFAFIVSLLLMFCLLFLFEL